MATDRTTRDESEEPERRGWSGLGRLLSDPLADLTAAAGFLRHVLPEIAADLRAIRRHIATMDPEMVGMHASVERIETEMAGVRAGIEALAVRMVEVEDAVARLEPHVADVSLVMRPLRRARARIKPAPPAGQGEAAETS